MSILAFVVLVVCSCAPVRRRETVGRCVDRVSQERVACHRTCEDQFQAAFIGCYGPPTGCTARCQSEQMQCQDPAFRALQSCEGDPAIPQSCRTRFDAELARCAHDARRRECEDAARGRASECWQACQRAHQPALERCAASLKGCLDACVAR